MPHKIGHAQQNVQNYFATLMTEPVTPNFGAELLCSVFSIFCFFLLLQTISTTMFYIQSYDDQEKNKMKRIWEGFSGKGNANKVISVWILLKFLVPGSSHTQYFKNVKGVESCTKKVSEDKVPSLGKFICLFYFLLLIFVSLQ